MIKKHERNIWERRASRKLIFVCFLIIITTIICFGGTYFQYHSRNVKAADEIWTNDNSTYDEKIQQQIEAEQKLQAERKGELIK